jgi:hypothetical protein
MQHQRQLRNRFLFAFIASWIFASFSWGMSEKEMCLQSEVLRRRQAKSVLNLLKDPAAMQVAQIKWPEYCDCIGDVLEGAGQDKEEWKAMAYEEQQRIYSLGIQSCVKKAGFSPVPQAGPKKALPADPFFDEKEKNCNSSGPGLFLIVESELRATNDPRVDRVRTMDVANYCRCYYRQIREQFSSENAKLVASKDTSKIQPAEEMMKVSHLQSDIVTSCVADQIPFESRGSAVVAGAAGSASNEIGFDQLFKGEFVVGKGLGPLKIGISTQEMLRILEPTNVVSRGSAYDEYRFGPGLTELKVRTAPSGGSGKVIYVAVNYRFRGSVSNGIKMGELFESVKAKLKPWEPIMQDRHAGQLLYKEGAQFEFADYNSGQLQGLIAFEPKTHPMVRAKLAKPGK